MTTFLVLLILAALQGLTEFLPVSSSGHLVLAKLYLPGGGSLHASDSIEVWLHLGTLLTVLLFYRQRVFALLGGLVGIGSQVAEQRKLALGLIVATLPVVVVGAAIHFSEIEWFENTTLASAGLILTSLILWRSHYCHGQQLEILDFTWKLALLVGAAQAVALIPGVSRSGATIVAALSLGFTIEAAAALSFLMSIPAIVGAGVLKIPGALQEGGTALTDILLAVGLSFFVGYLALGMLLWVARKNRLSWFAPYCLLLGLLGLSASLG
ncbi:MAG: undecaprenyl-diphosphate phosphatase [Planctomycetes bacterium]|jgi:undecaprenyl-diphosphatase|nr:undecaprenyl-diphosphate phosphatase [Planctomycetota bacterium]MBT4029683.1 undecaprenyl-diphosphate phosphatase [Planctomycetota bacterium]MBT4561183.1 undecaprenyl-diphosphate phosphatase [Planctomycetota bacterium]MBT5101405.1 undecaprenyl-diphosphate phosphatase [Planctomycetota bacterium]MBT5119687.1 undecaprenyl-diphosphate phosphatase [Planctomycetota bacterium]